MYKLNMLLFTLYSVANSQCRISGFSITQILREINSKDYTSAKSAILPQSEALNLDFHELLQFLKVEMAKVAFLELLDSPMLISRKI